MLRADGGLRDDHAVLVNEDRRRRPEHTKFARGAICPVYYDRGRDSGFALFVEVAISENEQGRVINAARFLPFLYLIDHRVAMRTRRAPKCDKRWLATKLLRANRSAIERL